MKIIFVIKQFQTMQSLAYGKKNWDGWVLEFLLFLKKNSLIY